MRAISIFALAIISTAAVGQTTKTPAAAPAVAPVAANAVVAEARPQTNRRDPFVSPLARTDHGVGSNCPVGKRCLTIEQIELKGVIASQGGMIALVVNSANRAYFLRENDAVFNGVVEQITRDSVTFRQNVYDSLGRPKGTRAIVRRITAPVV
jgi:Tfp pilus assembly protein PilP